MAIDGKLPIGIAGNRDKAEAVSEESNKSHSIAERVHGTCLPLPRLDIDNSKFNGRATMETALAIDERTSEVRCTACIEGEVVVPDYDVSPPVQRRCPWNGAHQSASVMIVESVLTLSCTLMQNKEQDSGYHHQYHTDLRVDLRDRAQQMLRASHHNTGWKSGCGTRKCPGNVVKLYVQATAVRTSPTACSGISKVYLNEVFGGIGH